MKKIFYFLILSIVLLRGRPVQAQDSTRCNARFSESVYQPAAQTFFQAVDSLSGVSHFWDFGDSSQVGFGDYSTILHTYSHPGTFTVKHIIRDSARGCYDSAFGTVTIHPAPPTCSITFNAIRIDSSNRHLFDFIALPNPAGGTIDTISWTINDTLVGLGDSLVNRTLPNGTSTVCVHMSTSLGCRNQYCQTIFVTDSLPVTPPADSTGHPVDSSWHPIDSSGHPADSTGNSADSSASSNKYISSYPNPATSQIGLDVKLDKAEMIYIRVYNNMGNQLQAVSRSGSQGINHITLPVGGLPMGLYYIQVQYGNEIRRSRVQKL